MGLGNIKCDLNAKVKVKAQIMNFLVNASPKSVDVATLNFAGAMVHTLHDVAGTGQHFFETMTPKSRSKVNKCVFAMVYHRLQSSCSILALIVLDWHFYDGGECVSPGHTSSFLHFFFFKNQVYH